jgi:pantoate--beta-alanine ligase
MQVVRTREALRSTLSSLPRPLGVVPTMGALHEGHRSLVRAARADCATVLVTIFVNPTQFNQRADYSLYPRDEARDFAICEADAVDVVFAPPELEMYPPGFDTRVTVGDVARPLEGAARPGHFDGVATVVAILLNLAGADVAYFGQKDAQQTVVIRRMATDLAIPTRIEVCPTVREPDGLGLSSRNVRLSPAERAAAPVLHRALEVAVARFRDGERDADALRATMREVLSTEPLARVDYVSCAEPETLTELDRVEDEALLSMAAYFGNVRLIDNVRLGR